MHRQCHIILIIVTISGLLSATLPGWATTQQALSIGSYTLMKSQRVTRIFNQVPAPTPSRSLRAVEAGPVADTLCAQSPSGWVSERHLQYPIRVWAQCKSDTDTEAESVIRTTLGLVGPIWAAETQLMDKRPIPDCPLENGTCPPDHGPDADGAIDFYVLNPGVSVDRDGEPHALGSKPALETPSPPYKGVTSSAFVLLDQSRINSPLFESFVAHEFFHVLQDAYNSAIDSKEGRKFWFVEASATWAQAYFAKETAAQVVHLFFPAGEPDQFQSNVHSLNLSVPDSDPKDTRYRHMYAAYIWPFFMQQEVGPRAIVDAWRALASVAKDDWDGASKAINSALPFATNFRTFALRNLNTGFPPEAAQATQQNPLGKRYKDLDDQFPDGKMPREERHNLSVGANAQTPGIPIFVELNALKAEYSHFQANENEVHSWELDFSGMTVPDTFGVDAVVHSIKNKEDKWEVRHLSPLPSDKKVTICEVDEIHLVLSNAALEDSPSERGIVNGSFEVKALASPCTCGNIATVGQWKGSLGFNYNAAAENDKFGVVVHAQANLSVTLKQVTPLGPPFVFWEASVPISPRPGDPPPTLTGSVSYNGVTTTKNPNGDSVFTLSGAGAAAEGSNVQLIVDLDKCTYTVSGLAAVEATARGDRGPSVALKNVLAIASAPRALPSGDFLTDPPSSRSLNTQELFRVNPLAPVGDVFRFGDGTATLVLVTPGFLNNQSTTAAVSWTLTPVPPPPR